jgi:hypothetical protein
VISCYIKPRSVEKFNWFKMQWSQANEIRPIFGISFCLQSPNVGGLWEGGDLERLSLVDDEEPNPRKFFLMSVLCTRVRLLLLEARVVFSQAEIFSVL